jgi:pilus assembly protein Flp/PilA
MNFVNEQYLKLVNAAESREEGQGLVEYALIIALIAVVLVAALNSLEGGIAGTFSTITGKLGT